ncbi:hypothetical protein A2686_00760 [Candidatus Woesebacteria bacterium RIFCSPHIGHO2_01_FULL_38_10]|uniref:Glycosyltransferase RgtA/B/C/D-like domain-containing protein n=1 Tax=Candidatus Woesebacteria bacterium RIFCSPLOWO2_01_FULL_39_10b TaxID=1802517 RepID=A0A1F8B9E1_9BACT|nr:MAG: hypothetical protein A2686_00760 [Candidatus Woesebacteria bacterium RIFCSPHIGHO2_01_FULL_38_10]OGM60637.1 MAG: hypothetical protein A2892_01155 [Candidatus Woesebacteria bacterium RIFCSPLOWO2_01_FULL_39_10b]
MKSKSSRPKFNLFISLVFGVIVLTSPWFWITVRNFSLIFPIKFEFITPSSQSLIEEVNTLRGELSVVSISPILARAVMNKINVYFFEVSRRYFESYDPQFLFFMGDLDVVKSTHSTGPIFLILLPLTIIGILSYLSKKKRFLIFLLLVTPVPAVFDTVHYGVVLRIPLFLVLSYIAVLGFTKVLENKKILAVVLILFFLFEFFRFFHDYYDHYPRRMGTELLSK